MKNLNQIAYEEERRQEISEFIVSTSVENSFPDNREENEKEVREFVEQMTYSDWMEFAEAIKQAQ